MNQGETKMKRQTKIAQRIMILLAAMAVLIAAHPQTFAQQKDYKPGEKIECNQNRAAAPRTQAAGVPGTNND